MLAVTIGQAEIGPKIREARDKKRWKQKELAAAVHVEPVTVSRWETGKNVPDFGMLERLAEVLGQPLAYFVTPIEEPEDDRLAAIEEELRLVRAELAAVRETLPDVERVLALARDLQAALQGRAGTA